MGTKKPVLVLINGLFYNAAMYKGLIRILQRQYRVVSVTIPFHEDHNTQRLVKLLHAKIKGKPVLMGHSAGALLAIAYAQKHPVSKLVLLSPPFGLRFTAALLWRLYVAKCFHINPVWTAKIAMAALPKTIMSMFGLFKAFRIVDEEWITRARKLTCPVVSLFGRHDELRPRRGVTEEIEVPGSHDWPLVKPDGIKAWLRRTR